MTISAMAQLASRLAGYARQHVLLVSLSGLFFLANLVKFLRTDGDFDVYYGAALRFLHGASIHVVEKNPFTYPGTVALFFAPLTLLGHDAAKVLFYLASCAALVLGITLTNRRLLDFAGPSRRWVFALSVLFSLRFILSAMDNQQTDLIIFGLIMLGAWGYQARSRHYSLAWGLATVLKVNPLFMALLPLFHRRWRQLVIYLAVVAALLLAPDLLKYAVIGEPLPASIETPTTVMARDDVPAVRELTTSPVSGDAFAYLHGFVRITKEPVENGVRWWERYGNPLNQSLTRIALYYLPPGVPPLAVFLVICALFALALWNLARLPGTSPFGLAILCYGAFVLIGPVSSKPHFVAMYGLLVICWRHALRERSRPAVAALAVICSVMGLTASGLLAGLADYLAVRGHIGISAALLWAQTHRVLWAEACSVGARHGRGAHAVTDTRRLA